MSDTKQEDQRVVFTYEEAKLLLHTDPIDYVVYMRLKFYADKETKTVGEKFNLAKRTLIGDLQIERKHGSTKIDKPATKDTLKASLDRLTNLGLVIVRSVVKKDDKRFIVELPKSTSDESVFFGNPRRTLDPEPSIESIATTGHTENGALDEPSTMNPRYQDINISNTNVLDIRDEKNDIVEKKRKGRKAAVKTLVPSDFQVTQEHIDFAIENQTPDPHRERIKFITHFQVKAILRPGWDASFRNWLLKAKEFASEQSKSVTASASSQYRQLKKSPVGRQLESADEVNDGIIKKLLGET
jgi:hypothetical protein